MTAPEIEDDGFWSFWPAISPAVTAAPPVPPLPGPELLRMLGVTHPPARPLERAGATQSSVTPTRIEA